MTRLTFRSNPMVDDRIHRLIPIITVLLAAALCHTLVAAPKIMVVALPFVAIIIVLAVADSWRVALVITILSMFAGSSLSMFAGSSGIEPFANLSATIMAASIGLLLFVTFSTTRRDSGSFAGPVHKSTIQLLWLISILALISSIWSIAQLETVAHSVTLLGITGSS